MYYTSFWRQYTKKKLLYFIIIWINRFSAGREKMKGDNRNGRLVTSISEESNQSIQTIVKNDYRVNHTIQIYHWYQ